MEHVANHADLDDDNDPDPTPGQMDALMHGMVWGSAVEYSDSMTCGHLTRQHDDDGCNEPFCGCNWDPTEISGATCGRPLAERRQSRS